MKKIMAGLFLVLLGFPVWAQTGPFARQFSGEQVISKSGKGIMTSKIYVDAGKVRVDAVVEGMTISTIMRPDKKLMYSIMPQQKIVMELPFQGNDEMLALSMTDDKNLEKIGTEMVGGQECEKYKMTTDGKAVFLWMNKATHTPVKMTSPDNSFTAEWKNVVAGPQPASLFEPPADYQKMQIPAGAMKGMPKGPPGQGSLPPMPPTNH